MQYGASSRDLNLSLVQIRKRAEAEDADKLVQTFVDVGSIFALLQSRDHQIVYGRRGTGKTHALRYTLEESRKSGSFGVYLDLRYMGSSGGLYADSEIPFEERATKLLLDVLGTTHDAIRQEAFSHTEFGSTASLLDDFAHAITAVRVVGETTIETEKNQESKRKRKLSAGAKLNTQMSLGIGLTETAEISSDDKERRTSVGETKYWVHFGAISSALRSIILALPSKHLILVLDEWTAIPIELQPYLADFIRRAVLPITGVTVKIGAIEQRSNFIFRRQGGDYIGMEVGADVSADINLDDFMVFENNSNRAKAFFKQLIFKHFRLSSPT